jgi:hypothetical protein
VTSLGGMFEKFIKLLLLVDGAQDEKEHSKNP